MKRADYINLCQKTAMLPTKALGIPKAVPDHLRVTYDGAEYYPVAYKISFRRDGAAIHTAILHDINTNSAMCAPLGAVKGTE